MSLVCAFAVPVERKTTPRPVTTSSVYVHAPFCVRRCFYCDFAVQVRREGDLDAWLAAISGELGAVEEEGLLRLADRLTTLYVGGGTPSLLGPGAMASLAGVLNPARLAGPELEWTAEANPESFTPALAEAWRRAGVNRVSLGVQTFHPDALRWMGRMHGPEGGVEAIAIARAAGFENVNADLVFGLPGRLGRDWTADLARVLELEVPHVSLYGLSVEPATPLGRAVREGREEALDETYYRDEFLEAAETLTQAGYRHYEVSNFARPGFRSRHNSVYWEGGPYLGLGNGAHSFAPPVRRWNLRDWDGYSMRATRRCSPEADHEILEDDALRLERTWLGLRTDQGLDLRRLSAGAVELAEEWTLRGLARQTDARLVLTPRGWLVLDRLAVELDHRQQGGPGALG